MLRFRSVPALALVTVTLLLSACGGGKATATVVPPATTAPTQSPTQVPAAAPTAIATVTTAPTSAATATATQAPTAAATAAPTRTAGATTVVQAAAVTAATTKAAPSAQSGPPQAHQLPGGTVMLPAGFDIGVFASDVGQARFMAVRPSDGALFVADAKGRILILPDANHDGKADGTIVFVSGLNLPSSIAFYQDWVYVAETSEVVRYSAPNNAVQPQGNKEVVIPNLPPPTDHWTRTIAFGPDGKLYLAIGSPCDVCNNTDERRAAISVYDPDGKNGRLFATGLRNAVGITWQPGTNQMWAAVNGRDNQGDNLPPDDLRRVNDGGFYGWPYCYNGQNPNPEYKDPSKCASAPPDDVALPAHSAALGLTFGDKLNAPQEYKDSIYIAYHGSWNRTVRTGYKVVRVPMVDGKPGQPQDFAWGWLPGSADNPGQVWGRPVGVTVGSDGALYVTDDTFGKVYRIAATG